MPVYYYVGKDNKFHNKDDGKVFQTGKPYTLSEKRAYEVNKVTDGGLVAEAEYLAENDISKLTVKQLKEKLDEEEIEYNSNDNKDELIKKLSRGE